jgi:tetratricopeptide (TPR) repeat protein
LLRSRFITNRIPFRIDAAMHFDLLHASRRFWRIRLKDCSLGNVERAILGVRRKGDVPSWEIPQLWFEYLRTRDARPLERVFNHHRYDILSLVSLTAWLSRCLQEPDGDGFEHVEDRLSLVRLHYRQKRYEDVVRHGRRLLETDADEFIRRECIALLADAYRRMEEWTLVEETWSLMLREYPKDLQARLELAKLHEHRTRNLTEAYRICRETVQLLETRETLGRELGFADIGMADFLHRLQRIERKLKKYGFELE